DSQTKGQGAAAGRLNGHEPVARLVIAFDHPSHPSRAEDAYAVEKNQPFGLTGRRKRSHTAMTSIWINSEPSPVGAFIDALRPKRRGRRRTPNRISSLASHRHWRAEAPGGAAVPASRPPNA